MGNGQLDALARTQVRLAAAAERIRTLEQERDQWRAQYATAIAERDEANAMLRQTQRLHRMGGVLLLAVRQPRVGLPRIGAAIRRRLPQRMVSLFWRGGPPAGPSRRRAAPPDAPPVCAYLALGVDVDELRRLTRVAAQAALVAGDHSVLIITDCVGFSLMRDTGVVFEYIPDRPTWEAAAGQPSWDVMRRQRLAHVLQAHPVVRTITVSPSTIPDLADLLTLHSAALTG